MHRESHVVGEATRAPTRDLEHRVRPFHTHVAQSVLDDLQLRLTRTRWSTPAEDGWKRGTDPAYLQALVAYWSDEYRWREQEARIAEQPQFIADVGDTELHFVHLPSSGLPLLLLHGWPDSFLRYRTVGPELLADDFEVIVPSLPGFAFSPPLEMDARPYMRRVAALLHELVTGVLGHERYGVVGGDGGSVLAQILAIEHPEAVVGIHLTDLGWHAAGVDRETVTWTERRYLARMAKEFMHDGGYAMVQSTRPHSLAPGLEDSPVGLASWIVDRFHAWSDGDLDARFGKDTLLTNIMLYWITHSASSSVYGYFAEAQNPSLTAGDRVEVPVGLALFPHETGGIPPRRLAERTLSVQRWTEMSRGGHFGALEEPLAFAREVSTFFRSQR